MMHTFDLTKGSHIRTKTVEELKSRLGQKELVDSSGEDVMIPETQPSMTTKHLNYPPPPPHHNEDGLIMPRKPMNPCLESSDRQNLHRELLFNQKIGKNVLNQKSELQRALEKHKDNLAKRELEHQLTQTTPELEKVIADRAKRLQDIPMQNEDDKGLSREFLQARAKLRTRNDSK
ncbi:uncharacterized protein CBL_00104 [Carabus blaptoides fortunei]